MLVTPWARDQLIAVNQNRVDFQEFGWWVLEHREVFSGPLAVISHIPLELSDKEIHQCLIEGARSMMEPQYQEVIKAVRVQRLKRCEVSQEDPTKSS